MFDFLKALTSLLKGESQQTLSLKYVGIHHKPVRVRALHAKHRALPNPTHALLRIGRARVYFGVQVVNESAVVEHKKGLLGR